MRTALSGPAYVRTPSGRTPPAKAIENTSIAGADSILRVFALARERVSPQVDWTEVREDARFIYMTCSRVFVSNPQRE
jgi:hypothetical protein